MMLKRIILILMLTAVLPAAAQTLALPNFGDPSREYLSPTDERHLGSAVVQRMRDQGVLIDDVLLREYLNSIGQRIAASADYDGDPFTFFWINGSDINAFASPGGFIGVYAGLFLATRNEDELAGVLAHEIAHVVQRHIARAFADAKRLALPMAAAMIAATVLAASTDNQAANAAMAGTMAANAQHQINFTRANEQEADRVGTQLLARAGFDPNGMSSFFERLQRLSGSADSKGFEFLMTHPLPGRRAADTMDRGVIRPSGTARDREAYYMAKARMTVLISRNTSDLLQHYQATLASGDYADESAERYGYVLALKRAGRYQEAQTQLARLLKKDPDQLALRIEEADLAPAEGDRDQAWRLFEKTRQLYPDSFALAMYYGRALATQGDPRKAMQILQPHLRRNGDDATLYALYAQAAQRAGDTVTTHAAMAEYHYLNGDLKQAIEQAELGLREASATPYQQAQLRARLRQFQQEKQQTPTASP